MDNEFDSKIIDENLRLKTFYLAGHDTNSLAVIDLEFFGILENYTL